VAADAFDTSKMRPASFRGVQFYVASSSHSFGRRTIVKEFPGRSEPFVEDVGKRARRYQLDAFVLGPKYSAQRNKLRAAFEIEDPGTLIHPYWGTMSVVTDGEVSVKEIDSEMGLARLTVTLVEFGKLPVVVSIDTVAGVLGACSAVKASLVTDFARATTFVSAIGTVYNEGVAIVGQAASAVRAALGRVQSVVNTIDEISDQILAIENGVSSLLALPGNLVNSIVGVWTSVCSSVSGIESAFLSAVGLGPEGDSRADVLARLPSAGGPLSDDTRASLLGDILTSGKTFGDDWTPIPLTTTSRQQQQDNRDAFIRTSRTSIAVGVAAAVVADGMTFADKDQALSMRDALVDEIDAIIALGGMDDGLYAALRDLQVAVVAHLNNVSGSLPDVIEFTPSVTLPSLVVAHRLYGDIGREAEIIARNPQIRHPGMIWPTTALRVLAP